MFTPDTAYAAHRFEQVIMARGGTPRIVQQGHLEQGPGSAGALEHANPAGAMSGSRSLSGPGSGPTACGSVRYWGLARVACQVRLTAIAFNLKRAKMVC